MMRFLKRTAVVLAALLLVMMAVPAVFAAGESNVDSSNLLELMSVAEKLRKEEFTADSWVGMDQAIQKAVKALEKKNQILINDASRTMAKAMSELKPMDFSRLNISLAAVSHWSHQDEETGELWDQLVRLTQEAQEARASGDQERVNEVAARIDETLEQLKQTGGKKGSSVIWIVLFFVSLAINVGFVVLVLIRTRNTQKYQKDDVPLVEYDIDDDIV